MIYLNIHPKLNALLKLNTYLKLSRYINNLIWENFKSTNSIYYFNPTRCSTAVDVMLTGIYENLRWIAGYEAAGKHAVRKLALQLM